MTIAQVVSHIILIIDLILAAALFLACRLVKRLESTPPQVEQQSPLAQALTVSVKVLLHVDFQD